ncbi:hypothetical protein Hanom_Chr14g01299031 [Helianthus anomalus]
MLAIASYKIGETSRAPSCCKISHRDEISNRPRFFSSSDQGNLFPTVDSVPESQPPDSFLPFHSGMNSCSVEKLHRRN